MQFSLKMLNIKVYFHLYLTFLIMSLRLRMEMSCVPSKNNFSCKSIRTLTIASTKILSKIINYSFLPCLDSDWLMQNLSTY